MQSVQSVKEYLDQIQKQRMGSNIFYRGQCGNKHRPLPYVFRKGFMDKEDYLYHELILRCPETFRGLSHLDILVMMQHYGLPTRLLDVSSNPLVALYFACKDYSHSHDGEPGMVYVYMVKDDKVAYADSDRVLMLSCLPVFSSDQKAKILKAVNEGLKTNKIRKVDKGRVYTAPVERLFHEIAKEVPAFKREIKPADLLTPIVVKPLRSNARIVKQDGAFILSGLCEDKKDAEDKIQQICTYEIEIRDRDQILDELDRLGINEATLFPEVDKVADYLRLKCEEGYKN